MIIEIKCAINVMCLNHPGTIPVHPRSLKKLSSTNQSVPKRLGVGNKGGPLGWTVTSAIIWAAAHPFPGPIYLSPNIVSDSKTPIHDKDFK